MEEPTGAATIGDLKRQDLEVRQDGDRLVVDGPIDVDAVVMIVASSVAGGL